MDKWITKGNWKNDGGQMFLNFKDLMAKYELCLQSLQARPLQARANNTIRIRQSQPVSYADADSKTYKHWGHVCGLALREL
jgi:hypothetical protein